MSIKSRYKLIKRKHERDILLFVDKGKYKSWGIDKSILNFVNFKNQLRVLEDLKINYKVIDNINIVRSFVCDDNQYDRYFYRTILNQVFDKILHL